MADVLEFKDKRTQKVWECECGGQVFYLISSGEVECAECKLTSRSIWTTTGDDNSP